MIKVLGRSDDLVEFYGDIGDFEDEIGLYEGILRIEFDDGTIADIQYGDAGIWKIELLSAGNGVESFVECENEDADIYSDVLIMKNDVKLLKQTIRRK